MRQRVFSGARPTGRQHIGNYIGAIQNYVKLQEKYDCIYCIVDIHALTTLESTSELQQNIFEMTLDWLAAGIDPKKSIVFVQSHVPEVMELFTLLGMLTPLGWLLRVPTFKEKARMQPQNVNYGLVGYPVLMAADIMLYKSDAVPVGEDQLPHLEMTREIVRRFNFIFGDTFPEPKAKTDQLSHGAGLERRAEDGQVVQQPHRAGGDAEGDAGKGEDSRDRPCPAAPQRPGPSRKFATSSACTTFSMRTRTKEIDAQCRVAGIGCVDCKKLLADGINNAFTNSGREGLLWRKIRRIYMPSLMMAQEGGRDCKADHCRSEAQNGPDAPCLRAPGYHYPCPSMANLLTQSPGMQLRKPAKYSRNTTANPWKCMSRASATW